jgi:hypothetical protein
MIDGDGNVIPVLRISTAKLVALLPYCELIEIDGIHPHLPLRWEEIYPVVGSV